MKNNIKGEIKAYYGSLAKKVIDQSTSSCGCGSSCCSSTVSDSTLYSEEFTKGLPLEAINASLGCANPIALANLQKGETVLDLGSGGGIDVFISSKYVGETGKVYGLDMTDEMLELANQNKKKMEVRNVEFIKGYIEDIPIKDETIDVITSNCVINLAENKETVLKEAYRVLKKGGRLAIADIVQLKEVRDDIKENIQMWVGCISGALSFTDYERILKEAGFTNIEITPVNVYTKEILKSIAEEKKLDDIYNNMDLELIDGAFGGAHVKAYKQEEVMDYKIDEMRQADWEQVADIYLKGIKTGKATFQTEVPTWEDWNNGHIKTCRLVARSGETILGWGALSPTSSRCVYAGVAEVSIYIGDHYRGKGIGKALLTELVRLSEENGFWTLQSGIIKENSTSIELHKKCGFRELGIREKVGKMGNGVWHDVVLVERRSKVVGIE